MRIPLFARGSNPAIDRPIQRKSVSYGAAEVEAGRADWVDANEPAKGIICRAFLYRGETLKPAQPEQLTKLSHRNALPPVEVSGLKFDDPVKILVTTQDRICLLTRAQAFVRFADLANAAQA